jgi:tetratricopeptide (TPR) repeat protein
VESVAWITERKNVLALVFYLASALAWLRTQVFEPGEAPNRQQPTANTGLRGWYWLSLGFFVCAVLSKTVASSLPAAMLLICWWKKGRIEWRDARPLLPFFAIGLALSFNTALMERTRVGAVGADWSLSPSDRMLIAGRAVWFYVQKLAWPVNLTFIYARWEINSTNVVQWLFPLAVVAVLVVLWLGRHRIGRGPLVAALFFGGTLVPALGFVNVYPMRFSFVADHFQYFAMIGPIALAAAALAQKPAIERVALGVPLLLGILTWRQTKAYRDLETLWADTIARNPSAWIAHNNLGNVFRERGNMDAAIERYKDASRLKPDYYEAQGNLGSALLQRGAVEEARASIDAALRAAPRYTPALVTRAAILSRDGRPNEAIAVLQDVLRQEPGNTEALNTLGSVFAAANDLSNAERAFEAALQLRPDMIQARVNLARVLARTGRIDDASSQVDRALLESPGDGDALNLKGMILAAQRGPDAAIGYFRDLTQRRPGDASSHFSLGTLLSQTGRTTEAIPEFLAAIQLNSSHAEAHNNLGIAYLITEQYPKAAEQFEKALQLRAHNPEAHNNLAFALIRLGRQEEAVQHLRAALALRPDYPEARAQLRALGQRP